MNAIAEFLESGLLTWKEGSHLWIQPSPVGLLVVNRKTQNPLTLRKSGTTVTVHYPAGDVTLECLPNELGIRLEVISVPECANAFLFGPYTVPEAECCGEMVGAAWRRDGSAVCIQSLNAKTVNGCPEHAVEENAKNRLQINAAEMLGDNAVLLLGAADMSHPEIYEHFHIDNRDVRNMEVAPVLGADGRIEGAAIQLLTAKNREELLEKIGALELKEGLPHPTIHGQWAKVSPEASEIYFVIGSVGFEGSKPLVDLAKRANVHCLYSGNPFASWGHFEINREIYKGGMDEFTQFIRYAHDNGVEVGFHTLSNFITTNDACVTPIPDEDLLVLDSTTLKEDLSSVDTTVYVNEAKNFAVELPLNSFRIGDEIIRYKEFDPIRLSLTGCTRGAFGTKVEAHKAGSRIRRYWEYNYMTHFGGLELQKDMAQRIGRFIQQTGARRMSFDGLEGCAYTGRGEYACAEFVRRVFAECGSELICDASRGQHYRWHAHSYFNWGEPWYDADRRGGMYNLRASHQAYFHRNLLPGMLGWYCITGCKGRFEATTPETMESILARTVAFDAGLCICIDDLSFKNLNGFQGRYMDAIALWQQLRREKVVPDDIRKIMQDKNSDWHLAKTEQEWILQKICQNRYPMEFSDQPLRMESGTNAYTDFGGSVVAAGSGTLHKANIVLDCANFDHAESKKMTPFRFRLRVGTPQDEGTLHGLAFYGGWYDTRCLMHFDVSASNGDYLVYEGGLELFHYDRNFNLLEKIIGNGKELTRNENDLSAFTIHYMTDVDDMPLELTHIQVEKEYRFPSK